MAKGVSSMQGRGEEDAVGLGQEGEFEREEDKFVVFGLHLWIL